MSSSSEPKVASPEPNLMDYHANKYVAEQREIFRKENEERRRQLKKRIYQEADFYNKMKINMRTFCLWILQRDD